MLPKLPFQYHCPGQCENWSEESVFFFHAAPCPELSQRSPSTLTLPQSVSCRGLPTRLKVALSGCVNLDLKSRMRRLPTPACSLLQADPRSVAAVG
eukprot:279863-Rhodomonas_salina.1